MVSWGGSRIPPNSPIPCSFSRDMSTAATLFRILLSSSVCVAHRRLTEIVRLHPNPNPGSLTATGLGGIMNRECLGFRVCFPPHLSRRESFPMFELNQTPQPLTFPNHDHMHVEALPGHIAQTN